MNLLQLRTKFRELSGRHDLVNDDYSDNGADLFINAGSKFLDRLDETQKSWASCFRLLEVDHWAISIPYCRAIKEVYAGSAEARWQVTKKDYQDLMEGYYTELPSLRDSGTPLYYSPCITRYIPENATIEEFQAFIGYVDVPAGNVHEYNSILFNVPTDTQLTIIVNGLFYSMELVEDTDSNYWSEQHPLLLIYSAMRQVEVSHRNTQGVNDWTNAINAEMAQLGFDLVEELIAEADQMEG